jgi:adenosylhomocysteine nucleosidase
MEAATLARLALANGLGFRAIKAISDTLEEDLPDMNPFITPQGKFATARFVVHVAAKPHYWSALSQFGKQASLAATNLCNAIADEIGIERPR